MGNKSRSIVVSVCVCVHVFVCDLLSVKNKRKLCTTCKCNSGKPCNRWNRIHGVANETNKQTTTMKMFAINFKDGSCCVRALSFSMHLHHIHSFFTDSLLKKSILIVNL